MAVPAALFAAGVVAYALPASLPLMWWLGGGMAAGIAGAMAGPGARLGSALKAAALWGLAVWMATLMRDSSWDGLSKHQESVLALAAGWNPRLDPEGKTLAFLAQTEPGLRESWILRQPDPPRIQHYLASLPVAAGFGWESGKWLGPILLVCAWGLIRHGLAAWGWSGWRRELAAVALALNPVALSQVPSLYFDGAYASALTAAAGASLLLFASPSAGGWVAWASTLLLCVCLKRAGLVGAGVLAACFLIFFLGRKGWRSWRHPAPWAALGLLAIAGFLAQFLLPAPMRPSLELVRVMMNPAVQDEGAGSNPELHRLPRWVQYGASHFAPTEVLPDRIRIKPPFWFTRPELAVFEDLSPDPRAGGFGPLYLTACLVALIPGIFGLGKAHPSRGIWLALLLMVLVTLFLMPSWWARWFPQGWWLPGILALALLTPDPNPSSAPGRIPEMLAWGTLGFLLLNTILLGVFTLSGLLQAERLIRGQLLFLTKVAQPVSVQLGQLAGARRWLDQSGIRWQTESPPGPGIGLRLHRSTVEVRLSPAEGEALGREPALRQAWARRNLLTPCPEGL